MRYLIGIDIGTSGTKSLLCDFRGKILATTTAEYPVSTPRPGWSEQDPDLWWAATVKTVRRLLKQSGVKGTDVAGIGLSGQMHGAVLLDRKDQVLRPAILWNDQRSAAECDDIMRIIGPRRIIRLLSNPALVSFTATRILWVRKHEPKVYRRTASVLLPKDYVRFRLTGVKATEVSDASGMLLLDVRRRTWSKTVLDELDIDPSWLADVYESPVASAKVSARAAKATGLAEGTPVVGGGGDQAAGGVGNGIVRPGIVSATLGTSGVVFAFTGKVVTNPEGGVQTFCHAVPGKWHVMGVVMSAGGGFQWFRNHLGAEERRIARRRKCDPYEVLTEEAAKAPPGAEGLYWLPYLTGERTPHRDPFARAAWVGITQRHTRAHLIRALLEGATYAMRDCLEVIRDMGVKVKQIRVSGGGARSGFWRQLQADVYGQPVVTINAAEGPAFGVALLAGVAAGAWGSVEEACQKTIRVTGETRPSKNRRLYNDHYPLYRKLYRSLKDDFRAMADLNG
ncbi:MAG TPA: xylulokinase [Planctomycetota bacterium]|nr:xylulokinase [Planctomycetota bacterium]